MNQRMLSSTFARLASVMTLAAIAPVAAQRPAAPYPAMAPLSQYLMDRGAEIALARTAAPPSISGDAGVLVLTRSGYETAAASKNGFVCMVERSWAGPDDAQFWNPKIRSPNCFNPQAVQAYVPIARMKARLILAGTSKSEMFRAVIAARDAHTFPAPAVGAMCYMMSKQQYLNDDGKAWHPHVMFFVPRGEAARWGADLPGSPVLSGDEPEAGITVLMVPVKHWSDGTAG